MAKKTDKAKTVITDEKAARIVGSGDSIVTLNEMRLNRDSPAKDEDREWLLFEAASAEVLQKEEVVMTIKKLEKELRPMGVILKTWAKPGKV